MENRYETRQYHPETFEEQEIKTVLPKELIEKVKEGLLQLDGSKFTMVGPIADLGASNTINFGVMEKFEDGYHQKYKISVTLQ